MLLVLTNYQGYPENTATFNSTYEYEAIALTDFEIYRSSRKNHAYTLAPLSDLKTSTGDSKLLFNGVIHNGPKSCYVRGIEFETLAIEGYGTGEPRLSSVSIQSKLAGSRQVWYQLHEPADRYQSYYKPFLWVASFTKHFVDFLCCHKNVSLQLFRDRFRYWMMSRYSGQDSFDEWLSAYCEREFAIALTTYVEFLWKEAVDVDSTNRRHFIWKEIDPTQLGAVKVQPQKESATVVTPYVYRCFKNCNFRHHLKVEHPSDVVKLRRHVRSQTMKLTPDLPCVSTGAAPLSALRPGDSVKTGDVIALDRDKNGAWKDDAESWFAYVQGVGRDRHGEFLKLIWLYRSADTVCSNGFYPYPNELFFSDHCNCGDARIRVRDVQANVSVKLFETPSDNDSEFFIRQTYITPDEESSKDAAFVTLGPEHLRCSCLESFSDIERVRKNFPRGTTVLIQRGERLLEPVVIVNSSDEAQVLVRRLLRRGRDRHDSSAKANELISTSETFYVRPKNIIRRCHVRRFEKSDALRNTLPPPYSYDGAADCWIITDASLSDRDIKDVDPSTLSTSADFIEGFDPRTSDASPPMKGMSLFGGWGGFDRGLEEGGAVAFKWVVEWAEKAVHSHRANLKDIDDHHLFLGSVNDYINRATSAATDPIIAQIGSVYIIVAGSPCKGFSRAQLDKLSERSKGHASLVASVLAFINLYCPAYAILENVFDMSRSSGEGDNVFSQIICALVGMGYQTQVFSLDAWAHGSSQTRSRLFVSVAAPGCTPISIPPQTHAHPSRVASRKVGTTLSGEKYGFRRFEWCPFDYVPAEKSLDDLPDIGQGNIGVCTSHPEHRPLHRQLFEKGAIMQWIPRFPRGCGSYYANQEGMIPDAIVENWGRRTQERLSSVSKSYKRMIPDKLLPTIRTTSHPEDSRHGQCVHWSQNRMMTLKEARRAQSIPDHEILVGSASQKWEIVGNGVDRKNTVALGMSLREAWLSEATQQRLLEHAAQLVNVAEHVSTGPASTEREEVPTDGQSMPTEPVDLFTLQEETAFGEADPDRLASRRQMQTFKCVNLAATRRHVSNSTSVSSSSGGESSIPTAPHLPPHTSEPHPQPAVQRFLGWVSSGLFSSGLNVSLAATDGSTPVSQRRTEQNAPAGRNIPQRTIHEIANSDDETDDDTG